MPQKVRSVKDWIVDKEDLLMINFLTENIGSANKIALKSFKKLPADVYEKSKDIILDLENIQELQLKMFLGKKEVVFLKNNFFSRKKRNRYAKEKNFRN